MDQLKFLLDKGLRVVTGNESVSPIELKWELRPYVHLYAPSEILETAEDLFTYVYRPGNYLPGSHIEWQKGKGRIQILLDSHVQLELGENKVTITNGGKKIEFSVAKEEGGIVPRYKWTIILERVKD